MLVTQQQMKKRRLQDDRIYVKNEYMFETNQDVGVESIATSEGGIGWSMELLAAPAAAAKLLQSCPTLCDPIEGSPPGSPIPGILQARTLEWVAIFLLH